MSSIENEGFGSDEPDSLQANNGQVMYKPSVKTKLIYSTSYHHKIGGLSSQVKIYRPGGMSYLLTRMCSFVITCCRGSEMFFNSEP